MTTQDDLTSISISMDGIWAGSGKLNNGIIEDCAAQFCDDNDASLAVYDDIEAAIAAGRDSIKVEIDGTVRRLTWSIVEPELTVGYVACDYTRGDRLADVPHATICATAEAAAMHDGYDGVRYVHTDGYLYVDQPE